MIMIINHPTYHILIIRFHLDHQVTGEHRSGLINSKSAYFHQVGFLISACLLKNESGLKNISSHLLNLQEKCSIVFRGDTRDVLILRLTHLALHGPNCSSSLSLSVQVVIDDHGGFGSHNQSSLLSSMIKVIINDQRYLQRSKQPSLLSCMPCPTCKHLLEVSP